MVTNKLKRMILPLLFVSAFVGLSSFTDPGTETDIPGPGTCKKSEVSTDYCTAEGGTKAGCSNSTSTDNC